MFHTALLSTLQVSWMQEYLVYLSVYHPKSINDKFVDDFEVLTPEIQRYLNFNHHAPYVHGSMHSKNWPKLTVGTSNEVKQVELDVLNKTQWLQVFEDVKSHKLEVQFKFNKQLPIVYLTGYGVELVVKSTEYLVQDDRKVKNTFTLKHNEDSVLDISSSMVKIEDDLLREKAWSYIHSLDKSDADKFHDLVRLSQNFPMYKEFISTFKLNRKTNSAIKYNSQRKDVHGIFINGLNIHEDLINSFGLDSLIRDEQIIIDFVQDPELLYSHSTDSSSKLTFEIPTPTWLNSVENNPSFKSYPKTLSEAFQMWQFYRQMMPVLPIQKHIINVVLLSNLLDFSHVSSILLADVALHIGIVPLPHTEELPGLAYTLHYIAKSTKIKNIRKFIKSFSELIDGSYDEKIKLLSSEFIDYNDMVSAYKSDYPSLLKFQILFDLKNANFYWLNGQIHELTSNFEQSVIQNARAEYATIGSLFEVHEIDDKTDFFKFFNVGFKSRNPIFKELANTNVLGLQSNIAIQEEIAYLNQFIKLDQIVIFACQFSESFCRASLANNDGYLSIDTDKMASTLIDLTQIPIILKYLKGYKNAIFINGKSLAFSSPLTADTVADLLSKQPKLPINAIFGLQYAHASINKRNSPYYATMRRRKLTSKLKSSLKLGSECRVNISATFDPFTEIGQKWISVLDGFTNDACISINPIHTMSKDINRFYRWMHPSNIKTVSFQHLPLDILFTSGIEAHPSWVVAAKHAVYDLDNLIFTGSPIYAEYELKHLLIEGHCFDGSNQPASGLQIELVDSDDTIVMANLGYFQLKANPGNWHLQLRKGPSTDIYNMTEVKDGIGRDITGKNGGFELMVDSFEGKVLFPLVAKIKGKEHLNLINNDIENEGIQWFKPATPKVINIFTIASGHLYERFLSIMVLSVLKHTKSKVKLWLIEDFLSPTYKIFLKKYAIKYKFDFEFVTYKWPNWLRTQKEKQRFIWGYKILFLDVLFPLNLDRIIFVDSDQIVRTDLQELMELDLKGKPYAYTPFCVNARESTKHFRFWEAGYWKSHLGSKPYHISALYVVDLKKFRQMGAGDLLRGQYQTLTADPNSLANLDQDLPNNMQDQVPIYSLPEEWLYCETWCADEVLLKAKTIDLCNNPLTKEPKLARAKRQIKEWTTYDDEIREFQDGKEEKKVKEEEKEEL